MHTLLLKRLISSLKFPTVLLKELWIDSHVSSSTLLWQILLLKDSWTLSAQSILRIYKTMPGENINLQSIWPNLDILTTSSRLVTRNLWATLILEKCFLTSTTANILLTSWSLSSMDSQILMFWQKVSKKNSQKSRIKNLQNSSFRSIPMMKRLWSTWSS